jgi:DNA-binding NtrC family response regulator
MKRKVFLMMLIAGLIIYINESTYDSLNSIMKNNFFDKVRELENVVERTVVFALSNYVTLETLPQSVLTTTKVFKESENLLGSKVEKPEINPIIPILRTEEGNKSQSERLSKLSERKPKYEPYKPYKPYKPRDIRYSKFEILI